MIVTYANKKLERVCNNEGKCRKEYPTLAKRIRLRHNSLVVASSMSDLQRIDPGGRWHPLHGNREGEWAGDLSGNYRIIVVPTELGPRVASVEGVEVEVTSIEDYH